MSASAQAIFSSLSRLKKDEVLRIQPAKGKSMRGLKTSVGRVASRNNFKIESWTDTDREYLYVRKA